jgi:hypothetical protein
MYNGKRYVFMVLVILGNLAVGLSHATDQSKRASPRTEHGTIVDKGRGLAVQLSEGSTYPINEPQESVHQGRALQGRQQR